MDKKHQYQWIQKLPTVIDNIHESCYKSYHILELVKEMIEHEDSKQTILRTIDLLENYTTEQNDIKSPVIS